MTPRLPSNNEHERALLGGLLLDPLQFSTVYDVAPPATFQNPRHRRLYQLIVDLRRKDGRYGMETVLAECGDDDSFGGIAYVVALPMACASVEILEVLAARVAELANRRSAMLALAAAHEALAASQGADDSAAALMALTARLAGIQVAVGGQVPQPVAALIPEHVDRVVGISLARERAARDGVVYDGGLLRMGYRAVDDIVGGIGPGNVCLLVGLPKMGKTALARGIAMAVARQGKTVLFFSYEMSKDEMLTQFIASEAGIDYSRVRKGELDHRERERYADAAAEIARLPIRISGDSPAFGQLRGQARSVQIECADTEPLGLVVVDYIQIMPIPQDRNETRENAVSKLSGQIKTDLARSLEVGVLALCQLNNKTVEAHPDKRPQASDTRESGKFAMDCDYMLGVHRPAVYDPQANPARGEVIVMLSRHGPTGTAYVGWERGQWIDADIDQRPPEPPQTPTRRQYRE